MEECLCFSIEEPLPSANEESYKPSVRSCLGLPASVHSRVFRARSAVTQEALALERKDAPRGGSPERP
jgi:hypothetical protein